MQNNINSVIVWGDSILKGVVSSGNSKEFEVTEENSLAIAGRNLGIDIINKSVFGSFMTKTRRTQDKNIRAGYTADIGIIESATNDCDYDWDAVSQNPDGEHLQRCPLDEFSRLLREAVNIARSNKITPIIATSTPLVGDWWFKNICIGNDEVAIKKFIANKTKSCDIYWLYRNQELFSMTAAKIAIEMGVQLVDLRYEFLKLPDYRNFMCPDGVHPNEEGYKFIATVWERELPLLKKEF
jgi:Lysophospholipase L1 and related esterases